MEHFDILVIGGGAAGIAAAKAAVAAGCHSVALVDRKPALGGVLLQCAHRGFGAGLTGREYAQTLLRDFPKEVRLFLSTTVLSVEETKIARLSGGGTLSFEQLIYAAGCRELPMGALPIAGTRPKGVYTAGQMQERMNLSGVLPKGPVVILGSGDIGLILAAQLAARDISVTLVEQKDACGGLSRNRRCLEDYPIRLICSQTIEILRGEDTLEGCVLSGGEYLPCKTLLIAAGLRPDRALLADLGTQPWLHLCGNCNTIHPMVEGVTAEGTKVGIGAAITLRRRENAEETAGGWMRQTVPPPQSVPGSGAMPGSGEAPAR